MFLYKICDENEIFKKVAEKHLKILTKSNLMIQNFYGNFSYSCILNIGQERMGSWKNKRGLETFEWRVQVQIYSQKKEIFQNKVIKENEIKKTAEKPSIINTITN